jgi:hypothetical protein
MTTDELREEIGVQVEKNDQWSDEYVLRIEAECMRLKDVVKKSNDIHNVSGFYWTDNDVDAAYVMGVMNTGCIDDMKTELDRLKEINLKPHEAVAKVRGK